MKNHTLSKKSFKQFIGGTYYFIRFQHKRELYELCLEPCYSGFCIGLYKRFSKNRFPELVTFKQCTKDDYLSDLFGVNERTEETWQKAIHIAQRMINSYFNKI